MSHLKIKINFYHILNSPALISKSAKTKGQRGFGAIPPNPSFYSGETE